MRLCTSRNNEFQKRLDRGLRFEDRVKEHMTEFGLELIEYGLNTYPVPVRRKLIKLDDPGSALLRYSPDFFCVTDRFTFFVEAKSKKGNSNYFSFNLDALNLGRELSRMGIWILVVFEISPLKASWLESLPISRVCEGSASGSGKSFVLIHEAELPSLREILRGISSRLIGDNQKMKKKNLTVHASSPP